MNTSIQKFTVSQTTTFYHKKLGQFTLESEWNGLSKLCREDGLYLIVLGTLDSVKTDLSYGGGEAVEILKVLTGSYSLLQTLNREESKKEIAAEGEKLVEELQERSAGGPRDQAIKCLNPNSVDDAV